MSEEKEPIIETARELLADRLVARTWGNLSRRVGADRYLITPSGRDYETMQPSDLVEVDFDGKWSGELKPSGERGLHTAIYRERSDAQFIIHTHQPYASAMSLAGESLELDAELAERVGSAILPTADYGLPSTKKLHKAVLETLRATGARAILMRGHGAVLFGDDPAELVDLAKELEAVCRQRFEDLTGVTAGAVKGHVRRFVRDGFSLPPQVVHIFMRREDAGAVIGDDSPLLLEFRETGLKAYLDDFSQLIGLQAGKSFANDVIFGRKAVYFLGADLDEAEAAREVSIKNALAAKVALAFGEKPLPKLDGTIMHVVYKLKYSKLKDS
ncbi:MAG: class II aldolase/adducin family protein [Mobiluncus porci]|uniref:class II aldolase/adducin family protein n=1 Tax=Mobiluncus porci TaxID=2652278 RepID=UPI0023F3B52F|nr:class II aldolase/adducin family protein [Mobiluncus porci]MDD7542429.1 class II aldolase/adducin family protein [Mobiluncus porci]MDY5747738.1 class II aldolase/adducin family protein [Mobiluncus porci]